MGVLGPLARSADDLALALDVLAGPRPADAVAWSLRLPPARAGSLREYRVAAWLNDPYCPVDESVLSVLTQTVETLRHEGARIDEDARPVDLGETSRLYEALLAAAMWPGLPEPVFTAMREAARDAPGQDEPEPLHGACFDPTAPRLAPAARAAAAACCALGGLLLLLRRPALSSSADGGVSARLPA